MGDVVDISTSLSWVEDLPTYNDLFPTSAPSLTRSFSLFSLFRRPSSNVPTASSLPTTNLLDSLFSPPLDTPPALQVAIRALSGLQGYATQLKTCLAPEIGKEPPHLTDEHIQRLTLLLQAYPRAFYLATKVVWAGEPSDVEPSVSAVHRSLRYSLRGTFLLYHRLPSLITRGTNETTDDVQMPPPVAAVDEVKDVILASVFPHPEGRQVKSQCLFTPLFDRARYVIQALQTASRPIAHSKLSSRASPAPLPNITEDQALEIMSLLELFAELVGKVESLPGPVAAKTKAQKEGDKRRPLRISFEAVIIRCDIAMSMANRDIKAIKWRASKAMSRKEEEASPGREHAEVVEHKEQKLDVDVTTDAGTTAWEELAESALVRCLGMAKSLMEERREGVMSDTVDCVDWLGEEEAEQNSEHSSSPPADSASPSATRATEADKDGDEDSDRYTDSQSEAEDDDEDDEEEESELGGTDEIQTTPLRTLFRLHDRYEEQRLAVWLSLPTSSRGNMSMYMRGDEGKVGEGWDALGLLLLLDYDSETLSNHGLSGEKLDKWIELASRRNAKKIRRKGRKTM